MGEKGLTGSAGEDSYEHVADPVPVEPSADDRIWQPDHDRVPAFASDGEEPVAGEHAYADEIAAGG